jgi:CheY-like chemotaxis protein
MTNLLNNAAKYTPDGGHIWFGAAEENGQVAVSVRDSGIGIAPENLANVFTMFAQLEPALERAQGGLGIGLALVKGLVTLHGGTIDADSAGIGQGSEFTLRLPTLQQAPAAAAALQPRSAPTTQDGKKVLVVDDNRDGADMLRMALDLMGHDVACVYDGRSALTQGQATQPQVVVLDIGLPDMDGYAVAREIRRQAWGKDVLLVAATGWGQDKDRAATAQAGFDIHLVKPVNFTELDAMLRAER